MQKPVLVGLVFIGAILFASSASAASYSYSSVNTSVSGGSRATAEVHTIMNGSDSNSEVWIDGKLIESAHTNQTPPPPPQRESDRQIIDRVRNGATSVQNSAESVIRVENNIQNSNGSTTGAVHIYHKENGQVIEDRTMPISASNTGKPFFFSSSATGGSGVSQKMSGRSVALDSHATIIRDLASSTGLPWLMRIPFFSFYGMGVSSATSVVPLLDPTPSPFVHLFDRVFSMFRLGGMN